MPGPAPGILLFGRDGSADAIEDFVKLPPTTGLTDGNGIAKRGGSV